MKLNAFIHKHAGLMIQCFNLGHFNVYLKRDMSMKDCSMDIEVDHRYLTASIRYGKKVEEMWSGNERQKILECIAHELMHILVSEITEKDCIGKQTKLCLHHEERVVEHISRLALRLYQQRV